MPKSIGYVLAVGVIALTMTSAVYAGSLPVPEIDANAVSAGLGLLAAGVLIVRSRRREK
jgi:MYXO-CTERM domain-containing protein